MFEKLAVVYQNGGDPPKSPLPRGTLTDVFSFVREEGDFDIYFPPW
jgi:hypothetical protein